jgi:hydrogenase expression/formation protein HypD
MKYIDEFRDKKKAHILIGKIKKEVKQDYSFMEFCGGHTHAIFKHALHEVLPHEIKLIHGPGCPVCILPEKVVKQAIEITQNPSVIFCTYGDFLRIPGEKGTNLLKTKAQGADIKIVYSPLDALSLARQNPHKKIVFMGIGFETTAPATALAIKMASLEKLKNFHVFCRHVLTPSAIQNIFNSPTLRGLDHFRIHGILGPSHVSAVIGTDPYKYFCEEFQKPVVIAGFEPLDILQSILMLTRQVNKGTFHLENQYKRVVTPQGNQKAQDLVSEIFELEKSFTWRGLGEVPFSSLKIKKKYEQFDIETILTIDQREVRGHPGCQCGAILRGVKTALDCKLFGGPCTPQTPLGPCMVSSEGSCNAYYLWHRGTHLKA